MGLIHYRCLENKVLCRGVTQYNSTDYFSNIVVNNKGVLSESETKLFIPIELVGKQFKLHKKSKMAVKRIHGRMYGNSQHDMYAYTFLSRTPNGIRIPPEELIELCDFASQRSVEMQELYLTTAQILAKFSDQLVIYSSPEDLKLPNAINLWKYRNLFDKSVLPEAYDEADAWEKIKGLFDIDYSRYQAVFCFTFDNECLSWYVKCKCEDELGYPNVIPLTFLWRW